MGFFSRLIGKQNKGPLKGIFVIKVGGSNCTADEGIGALRYLIEESPHEQNPTIRMVRTLLEPEWRLPCELRTGSTNKVVVSQLSVLDDSKIKAILMNMIKNSWKIQARDLEYFPIQLKRNYFVLVLAVDDR